MRKITTAPTLLRLLSLLLVLSLLAVSFRPGYSVGVLSAATALIAGSVLLFFRPLAYEDSGPSSSAAVLGFAWLLFTAIHRPDDLTALLNSALVLSGLYFLYRSVVKFGRVQSLFRADAVWCAVEDYARQAYLLILVCLCGLALRVVACPAEWPGWVLVSLALLTYLLLYLRAWSGRTMMLRRRKEETLRSIVYDNRGVLPPDPAEDAGLYAVYTKAVDYLGRERPFLDEDFSLADLAQAVFSNKLYLSRAINRYSGRNFRQFINYHRIMYSIELMKKDRRLRVIQLAMMSGFHSVVTYNMAFKLMTNTTPSEYLRNLPGLRDAAEARTEEGVRSR